MKETHHFTLSICRNEMCAKKANVTYRNNFQRLFCSTEYNLFIQRFVKLWNYLFSASEILVCQIDKSFSYPTCLFSALKRLIFIFLILVFLIRKMHIHGVSNSLQKYHSDSVEFPSYIKVIIMFCFLFNIFIRILVWYCINLEPLISFRQPKEVCGIPRCTNFNLWLYVVVPVSGAVVLVAIILFLICVRRRHKKPLSTLSVTTASSPR